MSSELFSWPAVYPVLTVLLAALVVMVADLFGRPGSRLIPWLAGIGLGLGVVVSLLSWNLQAEAYSGAWLIGAYPVYFYVLFGIAALITVVLSTAHEERQGRFPGEYYSLLLFGTVGMMTMASAGDLITLIIGLETMSVSAYVLVALNRGDRRSSEGAVKYFLLGAFASAFLLYGVALIYGTTRTTTFSELALYLTSVEGTPPLLLTAGVAMLLVGLGFKVAAVPFHMWAPDAYQAAPTPITGFMATAVKAAGFAAVLRIFGFIVAGTGAALTDAIWWLAVLSMVVGNFAALAQANLKRMLAYSSIAHAGYLLTAIVGSNPSASTNSGSGILFYLVAYALMTLGAFGVLVIVGGGADRRETLVDMAGLAAKRPLLAAAMAVFMISLSGIPPTAGFFGKFYVFGAAIESGYVGLAVIGVLTSVVGVAYYLRVVVYMYMKPAEKAFLPWPRPRLAEVVVYLLVIAVLVIGIAPGGLLEPARNAFASLF